MAEPHNYKKVGYSMIVVAASLTAIALIGLAIGEDVLYGDNIQRERTAQYESCTETGFASEACAPFAIHMKYEQCVAERDLDDPECFKFRTWVESAIFEECRANEDSSSPPCLKYAGLF